MIISHHNMFCFEALLESFNEFKRGKSTKDDVSLFTLSLFSHLKQLETDLQNGTYRHGGYIHFKITDPKLRDIHKASVRDRIVHHAVYRSLYPYFDKKFIFDSYSCRTNKGTHRAVRRFEVFARKESLNHTKTIYVLKCDIRKCFASVNHVILKNILKAHVNDLSILKVLCTIIDSFGNNSGIGIPLGNLTSQLFINVYLNEFDHFMKRTMRISRYIRYADDFVVLCRDKSILEELIPKIASFLEDRLSLQLHPDKLFIKTFSSGVDFLGWVHFADHRVFRTATKKRMFRNLKQKDKGMSSQRRASYKGMLQHGNAWKLEDHLDNAYTYGT